MKRKGSSQATGAALLVVGILIGAGLIFTTLYISGNLGSKTVSGTATLTSTLTNTVTNNVINTVTSVVTSIVTVSATTPNGGTAQVQASVTSCVADGTTGEICNLVLTNSGNANVLPTGSCSLTYGGRTWSGTTATTVLAAGSSGSYACTSNGGTGQGSAVVGSQVTGSVILSNGGNALFSATAS